MKCSKVFKVFKSVHPNKNEHLVNTYGHACFPHVKAIF